jgi:hypothetical protein
MRQVLTILASINWGFVAAIVALGAFAIARRDSKRNSRIMVKITDFRTYFGGYERDPQPCMEVFLENRGVPMQQITLRLGFVGPKGSGTFSVPLDVSGPSATAAGSFLRGSIAKFVL